MVIVLVVMVVVVKVMVVLVVILAVVVLLFAVIVGKITLLVRKGAFRFTDCNLPRCVMMVLIADAVMQERWN
jgi:hypothetical protein